MWLIYRYLFLILVLSGVSVSQLPNLRPLKGILNELEGPRLQNDTTVVTTPTQTFIRPTPTQTTQFITVFQTQVQPPASPGVVAGGAGGFGGGAGGFAGVGFGGGPSDGDAALEVSLQEGAQASNAQQQQQLDRPAGPDLELSSLFLSAFRRAEEEAEEASCVGRAMIESTKMHAARLNLNFDEAVRQLQGMRIDQGMCERILRGQGCEDFPRPRPCSPTDPYRRMDGSCNNLNNPTWGKSMNPFVRFHYPAYENGIDSMRGEGRIGPNRLPSPRTVSYNLQRTRLNPSIYRITLMLMQWGQFLDHDLTFTAETQIRNNKVTERPGSSTLFSQINQNQEEQTCPRDPELDTMPLECCPHGNPVDDLQLPDCRPINVANDPIFRQENRTCMRFVRSLIASKGCILGPREQLNQITSYIDGSMIYGSSDRVAQILREGKGGRLQKTERGNLLPRSCCEDRTFTCFKAGDTRVNEQPALTSMHTLWLRVHEQIVSDFAAVNPHWDDETLYQETRRVVAALIQQTTYREFLPLVLGPQVMDEAGLHLLPNGPGPTYDPEVDASIANAFATAAFRFGHTLVNDALRASGGESVPLLGNFENAKVLFERNTRPSAMLEGLAFSESQAPDPYLVLTLTNKLFAEPHNVVGLDLMSLNIQRGRDHGIPAYMTWRRICLLPTFTSFEELLNIMPEPAVQVFRNVYNNVNDIDLFPAALSEYPVPGGLLGPTFACIQSQQFSNLMKGDRFFFQNILQPQPFNGEQLASIGRLSLAAIICHHSDIQFLQPRVFESADAQGNEPRPCSSYPRLDPVLWKAQMPPVGPCLGVGPFRGRSILDEWCTINCFHVPSFCPPTHCSCY